MQMLALSTTAKNITRNIELAVLMMFVTFVKITSMFEILASNDTIKPVSGDVVTDWRLNHHVDIIAVLNDNEQTEECF